jgi:NADP-dependent 3-hydroxy acid dehydrogenase YdfG
MPPLPWSDRTVLVTGASAGFGREIARRFAALGAPLVIAGRRVERLEALAADLAVPVHVLPLDVRDEAAVVRAIESLPGRFAEIDILVNNAGLALGLEPADRADPADWQQMIETNLWGLVRMTRAVLPGMVARDRGHIVSLGSVAGTYPYPGSTVYGATKAAVAQFSPNLLADLVKTGVRVTNIEPGLCGGTEFSTVRFHGDSGRAESVYAGTAPLTAEDVAEAVVWAASQPPHVNINRIEMMPTCQAPAGLAVYRREG